MKGPRFMRRIRANHHEFPVEIGGKSGTTRGIPVGVPIPSVRDMLSEETCSVSYTVLRVAGSRRVRRNT